MVTQDYYDCLPNQVREPHISGLGGARNPGPSSAGSGFYPGQIDGLWGPAMQSSIERFQQGRGLQATGQLNPATVTALRLDPNNLAAQTPVVAPAR